MTRTRRQKSLKALKKERLKKCYSGKACFPDRFSAELFIIRCRQVKKEVGERNLVRAYRCPSCRFWHVTSHK